MNSDNAQTIHQVASDLHRQQQRERRSLPRRLQEAITRAAMLSTVSSHSGSETGKLHQLKPSDQMPAGTSFDNDGDIQTHVVTFNMEAYIEPMEHLIERFEQALDEFQGLGVGRHYLAMSGEELDKEISLWAGTPAYVVAARTNNRLGNPRTIERRRLAMGVKPYNGLPHDDENKAA